MAFCPLLFEPMSILYGSFLLSVVMAIFVQCEEAINCKTNYYFSKQMFLGIFFECLQVLFLSERTYCRIEEACSFSILLW